MSTGVLVQAERRGEVLIPTDEARMLPPAERALVSRIQGYGGMWRQVPAGGSPVLAASSLSRKLPKTAVPMAGTKLPVAMTEDEPVKRVSIFDQWTGPADGPAKENPQLERFDRDKAHSNCRAKCANRPGWHPTDEVRSLCVSFCDKQRAYAKEEIADPQPAGHAWYLRDGVHYPTNDHLTYADKYVSGQHGQMLLQTSATAVGADGLDGVKYGSKTAMKDIDSYFDSLPTTDCLASDCNFKDTQVVTKVVKKKPSHPSVSAKQLKEMERKVLGYHRAQEDALEKAELGSLSSESNDLVDGTDRGYDALERKSKDSVLSNLSKKKMEEHRRLGHSHAYSAAKHDERVGFQGYYSNVFKDIKRAGIGAPAGGGDLHKEIKAVATEALADAERIVRRQLEMQKQDHADHRRADAGSRGSQAAVEAEGDAHSSAVDARTVDGMLGYDPNRAKVLEKREWRHLQQQSKF